MRGLRVRNFRGDPLNLIRIMPAKGQDVMPTSIYLARLLGPVLAIVAASMLAAPLPQSPAFATRSGIVALLAGAVLCYFGYRISGGTRRRT